jgi:hypothetical protein
MAGARERSISIFLSGRPPFEVATFVLKELQANLRAVVIDYSLDQGSGMGEIVLGVPTDGRREPRAVPMVGKHGQRAS